MLLFTSKPPMQRLQRVLQRVPRVSLLFIATVLLPVTLAVAYFGFIASDVYVSEARFVVRGQQQQQSAGMLGTILGGAGMSRAQDEAYSVHDFILSRDALQQLDKQLGVRRAFSDENIDVLSRFPGLDWNDSFEALYRYYPKRVMVTYEDRKSVV